MNIEIFQKQISFKPEIQNAKEFSYDNVVIGGIGGSGLVARILYFLDPVFPVWLHNDFGLPEKTEGNTLFVAISHSGNTRETISFANEVLSKGLSLVIITSGGVLLDIAQKENIPYVLVPGEEQPRDSSVYMLKALLLILKKDDLLKEIEGKDVTKILENKEVSEYFKNSIPLIYSSTKNSVLGYIWKIIINETSKFPAFCNVFPELTHNEIQGIMPKTNGNISSNMKVLMLMDSEDNEGTVHSMKVFEEVAQENGIETMEVKLPSGKVNKLFETLVVARDVGHKLDLPDDIPADRVPAIESFKKKL